MTVTWVAALGQVLRNCLSEQLTIYVEPQIMRLYTIYGTSLIN